jgi:hypothetical protein
MCFYLCPLDRGCVERDEGSTTSEIKRSLFVPVTWDAGRTHDPRRRANDAVPSPLPYAKPTLCTKLHLSLWEFFLLTCRLRRRPATARMRLKMTHGAHSSAGLSTLNVGNGQDTHTPTCSISKSRTESSSVVGEQRIPNLLNPNSPHCEGHLHSYTAICRDVWDDHDRFYLCLVIPLTLSRFSEE